MSSIVGPVSPSAGGGGGNVIDTLQSTLGAGDTTGSASGILFSDGDVLAMASGAIITFSSNSNPGGMPDVIIQRSGVSTLAVNQPGGGGANINVGNGKLFVGDGTNSAPALAFDRERNTGIYRRSSSQLAVTVNGTDILVASPSAQVVAVGAGLRINSSSILSWSDSNAISSANTRLAIAQSGIGLASFYNPTTFAPASGHFGALIVGPLSASGSRLVSDNNGRLLVQNGDGVAGDLTTNNLVVGGTITPLGHITQTNSRWRMQNTAQLDLVSGGRLGFSSSSTNATSQIDSAIVRSGVSSLALTNPITSGPANLTVGDLTVLGSHNITGGASTSVFSTGILLGPTSPVLSGVELRSDENGSLIIVGHGSASASDSSIKVRYIRAPFDGNEVDISINNQLAMAVTSGEVSIGSSSRNVALIDSTYRYVLTPNRYWGEEAGRGGLLFGSGLSLMWSSVEDMSSFAPADLDSAIVRSGVGSLALTNPSTSGPASLTVGDLTVLGTHNISAGGGGSSSTIFATGLIIGNHSPSGSKLANDANGRLLIQNANSILATGVVKGLLVQQNSTLGTMLSSDTIIDSQLNIRDRNNESFATVALGYLKTYDVDRNLFLTAGRFDALNQIRLGGKNLLTWTTSDNDSEASPNVSANTSGTMLGFFNYETGDARGVIAKNYTSPIYTSGAISGDLRIDMQGSRVQTFSVSTTGVFTPYNLSYLSSEKQLFVTAVGTVGVTFDSSIKWLGSKPVTLGSGVTYMFSLMNYSPTQIVASYEALSDG